MRAVIVLLFCLCEFSLFAPPIRYVSITDDIFEFTDCRSVRKILNASAVPAGNVTPALAEAWVNNIWIPANITGFQMRVHVFSLSPLRVTIGTWNTGETISTNWWQ